MERAESKLNVLLALLLGMTSTVAFTSLEADGYPSVAVSTGSNPVVATGGSFEASGTATLFVADEGMDIVMTDLVLSISENSPSGCHTDFVGVLRLSDGTGLGEVAVTSTNGDHPTVVASLASGLRVPAGQNLEIEVDRRYTYSCSSPRFHYMASGYLAQS